MLLIADVVADLHLLLDEVFRLDERADELLALFPLKITNLVLVDDIGNFELFLFGLELSLLVDELLSEYALLVVQVQEHAQIPRHLIVLLGLDDALDLALLRDFLPDPLDLLLVVLRRLRQEAFLLLAVDLRLQVLLLPDLLFQKRLVVLVQLTRLPEGHLQAARLLLLLWTTPVRPLPCGDW